MWIFRPHTSALVLTVLSAASLVAAKPVDVLVEEPRDLHNASQLERRACPGGSTPCGYYGQVCCGAGESCYTDANNQAQCGASQQAATTGWVYYTSIWTESSLVTRTSIYSSYFGGPVIATPTANTCANGGTWCQGRCCGMGYYCQLDGSCGLIGGGSSPAGANPSAPLRPTSSTLIIITATGTPTATVPFQTPIATGVNGTVPVEEQSGGLSGGAIAGIVIGVIAAIILLILICLYCCARALFDTVMAIFGLGKKKRKHTHEETYIEEHHHHSGSGVGGGRWYGSRPARPAKKKTGGGNLLGLGAALGGLALALGLKRRHDRKYDDKSTVSGTSASYSYYTSTSE
jgi:ubiquitin-activating enzyme E1